MKIFTKVILALALVSSLAAQQPAKDTADQPSKDQSAKKDILAGREGMTENFFKLAFVMYELEGLTFKEIAAKTKVPIGTLMARKKYAVDFLREHLKEIYYDDE